MPKKKYPRRSSSARYETRAKAAFAKLKFAPSEYSITIQPGGAVYERALTRQDNIEALFRDVENWLEKQGEVAGMRVRYQSSILNNDIAFAFGNASGRGLETARIMERIKSFTRQEVAEFYKSYHLPASKAAKPSP